MLVTLCLGIAKLLGGWFGHSLALLSDSLHSFGDALSSASVLGALWLSEQPPDREHPYGHTRIETIAASNVALLLLGSGVWVAYQAISTWNEPSPTPHRYTLVIAFASVVMNEVVFRYSILVAKKPARNRSKHRPGINASTCSVRWSCCSAWPSASGPAPTGTSSTTSPR